jgi:Delta7-sterol 5-desaturase
LSVTLSVDVPRVEHDTVKFYVAPMMATTTMNLQRTVFICRACFLHLQNEQGKYITKEKEKQYVTSVFFSVFITKQHFLLTLSHLLVVRYSAISGTLFLWWYGVRKTAWAARKIQPKYPTRQDYKREIGYSLLTFCVFATVAATVYLPQIRPYTRMYTDTSRDVWSWLSWIGSVVIMLIVHDFYFYWMHRVVHAKKLYPYIHKVHHLSHNPSPWAAFAFHPLEALTEFLIFPIIVFTIPHTISAIATWLLIMTLYNAYGHLGFELYPQGFSTHAVGRWINTSVNHNMHHKYATSNYGLYTIVWDRLFGTLHPKYEETFEEVVSRSPR